MPGFRQKLLQQKSKGKGPESIDDLLQTFEDVEGAVLPDHDWDVEEVGPEDAEGSENEEEGASLMKKPASQYTMKKPASSSSASSSPIAGSPTSATAELMQLSKMIAEAASPRLKKLLQAQRAKVQQELQGQTKDLSNVVSGASIYASLSNPKEQPKDQGTKRKRSFNEKAGKLKGVDPAWGLSKGWKYEAKTRKTGKTKGVVDYYYHAPDGKILRSLPAALSHNRIFE